MRCPDLPTCAESTVPSGANRHADPGPAPRAISGTGAGNLLNRRPDRVAALFGQSSYSLLRVQEETRRR
jgi:hypothetical protein